MNGQLWPKERELLYSAVAEKCPSLVLEVGTWKGGGSTYQIASALNDNRIRGRHCGKLITCETHRPFYDEACEIYKNEPFCDIVSCHNVPSTEMIESLISARTIPDFTFFDGPDDADLTLNDFKLLEPHLKSGAWFCMHDWDIGVRADGNEANKPKLIRPYVESNGQWKILKQLTVPVSVGLVLAEKR